MSGRGGRDRFRRDNPVRFEERNHHGRSSAMPSRHLWVGNLSHNLSERTLADHFLQFGELDSIAFQPGRSYAFINYKHDEEAFAAIRALQGFFLAGNPLKIEFAKAEKSSTSSVDEDYLPSRRDEQRSSARGPPPFSQRESRGRRPSPDPSYSDKSKIDDKNAEPSEVLWIGFPAVLKVDESALRKAFSPFGEIVKISAFPGRTYAFVRFKHLMSACRAKETLHGKLFGNPRVHICFARSESNSGRNSIDGPPSPNLRSYGRLGSSDNFRPDRSYENFPGDPSMRSPRFVPDLESRDPDGMTFQRKGNLWAGENPAFEQGRFRDVGLDLGPPRSVYEHRASPPRDRNVRFRDFSPQKFPRQGQLYDDAWDLPDDAMLFHEAKKHKTGVSFLPEMEHELPEYPLFDSEQVKHVLPPRIPDFPQHDAYDRNFDSRPFEYNKQIPDRAPNLIQPYGPDRSEHWNAPPPYDNNFLVGAVDRKISTPELHQQSSPDEVWKWEGTIGKGGNPVCRARCFPVGKVLDMRLPDFLDCTARTGLDMLAKHYDQAANAWVVFFVPQSDADIAFYNEFMNYLGGKQRAAVAKLDENTTLFLVPPSEFSEKVLKVPGKLSMSGVILRLENPGSSVGSLHNQHELKDTSFPSFHGETSYPKPASPYSSGAPIANLGNPRINNNNMSFPGKLPAAPPVSFAGSGHSSGTMPHPIDDNRPPLGSNWSALNLQNSNSGNRNITSQASSSSVNSVPQEYNPAMPRAVMQPSSTNYTSGPAASLQPEQLAQLAQSLLGQQRQSGVVSAGQDSRQSGPTNNQSDNSYRPQSKFPLPNNQGSSEFSSSQLGQFQQLQQYQPQQQQYLPPPPPPTQQYQPQQQQQYQLQQVSNVPAPRNQQLQNSGTQEEGDADPEKRLQATLQLAAALLQQIQQGKGN